LTRLPHSRTPRYPVVRCLVVERVVDINAPRARALPSLRPFPGHHAPSPARRSPAGVAGTAALSPPNEPPITTTRGGATPDPIIGQPLAALAPEGLASLQVPANEPAALRLAAPRGSSAGSWPP